MLGLVLLAVLGLALTTFAGQEAVARAGTGEPPAAGRSHVLNVAFVWHMHQPLYEDPVAGIFRLPWVRMHALKDYLDMVTILEEHPAMRATFNLTPSLLYQLDAYASGAAVDTYQQVYRTPAESLSRQQKQFLLRRFFDANWDRVIARFPRYLELLEKRGRDASDATIAAALERFTTQDYRDLQVWFDLAWFDPDLLANHPRLRELVEKGHGFSEYDKAVLEAVEREVIQQVVGAYRRLQDTGQIEVITTPYAHPILPLLHDTDLAWQASRGLNLPDPPFRHPEDVRRQLVLGVESYRDHFGREPRGLWPSEQAVGEAIIPAAADAGFRWMVASEGILARSLGVQLRDGSGRVARPDLLYQPYRLEAEGREMTILFRDLELSDRVGFTYSGMPGDQAARNLVEYLGRAYEELGEAASEKVVVIALDGENAWEYYENDGKLFFRTLYRLLSEDERFRTVTVSEYLEAHPATAEIDTLWTGSWISDNLETWIGEAEENQAWAELRAARQALAAYERAHPRAAAALEEPGALYDVLHRQGIVPDETARNLALAWKEMLAAQGSDWFWWYGDDQDSGNDAAFDELFRAHLQNVYRAVGAPAPDRLHLPIARSAPAVAGQPMTGLSTPVPNGWGDWGEWDAAARYDAPEGPPGDGTPRLMRNLFVALDHTYLSVRVDFAVEARELAGQPLELAIYLDHPTAEANAFTRHSPRGEQATRLGFPPALELRLDLEKAPTGVRPTLVVSRAAGGGWAPVYETREAGLAGSFEARVPLEVLGYEPGQPFHLSAVLAREGRDAEQLPASGAARLQVPAGIPGERIFVWDDPEGDDHGPGSYTYPTNPVFVPSVFDMTRFEVYETPEDVYFVVTLKGPIDNVWNSPIGLSVQTLDIYIDTDRAAGSGKTATLGGRNVTFAPEHGWEFAIWVEGWHQRLFTADGRELAGQIRALTDPVRRQIVVQVPKSLLGQPQPWWGYQAFILGQEGFPAEGSLRVREVLPTAQEWRFGGGHLSSIDPNVIDLLAPAGTTQEAILGAYDVEAGRLAQVPMVYGE